MHEVIIFRAFRPATVRDVLYTGSGPAGTFGELITQLPAADQRLASSGTCDRSAAGHSTTRRMIMQLVPGSQVTVLLWSEPQQFTVTQVDQDTTVHVRSNVQPLGLVVWPTSYRPGVTLHKLTRGW